jgi:protocatechuate 3,4-dioxygenase beta subunit
MVETTAPPADALGGIGQGRKGMKAPTGRPLPRRRFLRSGLTVGAPLALAALGASKPGNTPLGGGAAVARAQSMSQTPACQGGDLTVDNAEGPYYKLYTPERRDLRTDLDGAVLLSLSGRVLNERCQPVVGALLDFWQANQQGEYDLNGYTLRGHQYSLADGTYLLETVIPHWYIDGSLWRTSHIHVKVQAPYGPILTTQLFFPDTMQAYGEDVAALNAQDFLVPPEGIDKVTIQLGPLVGNRYAGVFDFGIATEYPALPTIPPPQ